MRSFAVVSCALAALAGALLCSPAGAAAQGVATSAIHGGVVGVRGAPVEGASVRVENTATGYVTQVRVRGGAFLAQGLEVGGPYSVSVGGLGLRPWRIEGIRLTVGEAYELSLVIEAEPIALDTLTVVSDRFPLTGANGGTSTMVTDSLIRRLPTLDRNVYDFVRLVPQVSTKVGSQRTGISAVGANLRFNRFLIDGADERFVSGNVSAALNNGKSIPLEAVKAYQVLIAPYDVRYGEFAGALVNTISESGTNEFHGTMFGSWRNDRLARARRAGPSTRYDEIQYGFALGGPIVRDRVHFFVAPELRRRVSPADGPFVGQSAAAFPTVPAAESDLAQLEEIMAGYGLSSGTAGPVENSEPLRNLFVRIDATKPGWNTKISATLTYSGARAQVFSRAAPDTFALSSYQWTQVTGLRMAALRVDTDVGSVGGHNQLTVSQSSDWGEPVPDARQPLLKVLLPRASGGTILVRAGSAEPAQGRSLHGASLRVRDDLGLPLGASHVLRLGAETERFRVERGGVNGGYGVWTFSSLDALEAGTASRYELRRSFIGERSILRGGQYAAWVGDEWRVSGRLSLTWGVRADLLDLENHAPYVRAVDSIFGRRTDQMPEARVRLSPRVGFTWDLAGPARAQLRGGVGLFTGRPPLAWIAPAISSYGVGTGVLRCGALPTDAGAPPPFEPDYRDAPTACGTGSAPAPPLGDVDLLDARLDMARTLRASLAYDRVLPWNAVSTTEVLVSRHVSDFKWVNLNLAGPQATDRFGRVLYGSISPTGVASPVVTSGFAEVIDLQNTSKNSSYQLSTRLEKRWGDGVAAMMSYTFSRVRDVQSPSRVNSPGIQLWADARTLSGSHEDESVGVSLNDLPHRVVAALTVTSPWRSAPTDFSVYYVGESGSPFTYVAGGGGRAGDLNADGSNANDPIYVPRSAFDPTEILFSGISSSPGADNSTAGQAARVATQQASFTSFVEASSCLRRYRGRILERNACREPWSHTVVASVRQALPVGGRRLEAVLDVYNVLDLLHRGWGSYRVAAPLLLEHVGQTMGGVGSTQPIFRFDGARSEWTTLSTESSFQLQLTARYRF